MMAFENVGHDLGQTLPSLHRFGARAASERHRRRGTRPRCQSASSMSPRSLRIPEIG
jgi:hypothetical protein